jgi:hypothetical protein
MNKQQAEQCNTRGGDLNPKNILSAPLKVNLDPQYSVNSRGGKKTGKIIWNSPPEHTRQNPLPKGQPVRGNKGGMRRRTLQAVFTGFFPPRHVSKLLCGSRLSVKHAAMPQRSMI